MGMTLNKCIDFSVDYGFFCTFVNDLYKLLIMKKNLVYVFRCTVMCVVLFLVVIGHGLWVRIRHSVSCATYLSWAVWLISYS